MPGELPIDQRDHVAPPAEDFPKEVPYADMPLSLNPQQCQGNRIFKKISLAAGWGTLACPPSTSRTAGRPPLSCQLTESAGFWLAILEILLQERPSRWSRTNPSSRSGTMETM